MTGSVKTPSRKSVVQFVVLSCICDIGSDRLPLSTPVTQALSLLCSPAKVTGLASTQGKGRRSNETNAGSDAKQ